MSTVPISVVVNVSITRTDRGISQAGFGIPLILGDNGSFGGDRIRSYTTIDEVLDDFASSDDEYKAAAAIFSQNPKVRTVKIGVEDTRVAMVQTLVFSASLITGNTINGSVDGVALAAVPFNTSNAQTLTDLAAAIQATDGVGTAVSNGTNTITVTAAKAGVPVTLSGFIVTGGASQATVTRATTVDNHGVTEDLQEISEEDDAWYGLIWTERDEDHVLTAAGAIETKYKIFITCSDDSDILDGSSTTDIAAVLAAANYARTALIYNADPTDFADAAWMGNRFPLDPGTENFKFCTLAGITADNLTSSQRSAINDKNANMYVTIAGTDITMEGYMASGEYIDLIRLVDWIHARIEENIFQALVDQNKIPYTDDGVAIIKNKVREILQQGVKNGAVAQDPAFTVSAPKVADISSTDRANRFLPDVEFTCRLTGAINTIDVAGVVTV